MSREINAMIDISQFSTLQLISELRYRDLRNFEIEKLKTILNYDFIPDKYNQPTSLDEVRKLEVVMENLEKKSYLEICSFFEGTLPFTK